MADVSSVTSGTERLRPALLKAAEHGQVDKLRELIHQGKEENTINDVLLRWALQRAAERGQAATVTLLLEENVDWDANTGGDRGLPALYRAVQRGHKHIVQILLEKGADTEAVDRNGRSVIHAAAWWNRKDILRMLIDHGANVNSTDRESRTILHGLAADKAMRWGDEVIEILLEQRINLEHRDDLSRTALHWAAHMGKEKLTRHLLTRRGVFPRADIHATTDRGKTALHLAADAGHANLVKILLSFGAKPFAQSDGAWTALHNAAHRGHTAAIEALVQGGCDINVRTAAGMTPLHWASAEGHLHAVDCILKQNGVRRNLKDVDDRTPLLCAAINSHPDVIKRLAPLVDVKSLTPDELGACQEFMATIVDFGINGTRNTQVLNRSVYEVLYGKHLDSEAYSVTTLVQKVNTRPIFRWIHLPANNMAWVETLITKHFFEDGATDIDGLRAMQATFGQHHQVATIPSRSMRPLCQRIQRSARSEEARLTQRLLPDDTVSLASEQLGPSTPKGMKSQESGTPKSGGKGGTKFNKKNPSKNNLGGPKKDKMPGFAPSRGNMVMFVPYLHFEDERRIVEMSSAIRRAERDRPRNRQRQSRTRDEMLVRAYLNSSAQLHVRRTLDQFYLHDLDEEEERQTLMFDEPTGHGQERKVLMFDQLWVWVLGRELVITSFPQRWQQPQNDPYNVLDGIVEGIKSRTGDPIMSVYDLVALITYRCFSVFDRQHQLGNEDNRLLNMFEGSVEKMVKEESALFSRFYTASSQATAWLKRKRTGRNPWTLSSNSKTTEIDPLDTYLGRSLVPDDDSDDDDEEPLFVDSLLDVGKETTLLAQCRDAQDKLDMIRNVLENQTDVLREMQNTMLQDLAASAEQRRANLLKKFDQLRKKVEDHRQDVARMREIARQTYEKILPLLDLKQKHANAFEARFARDQAASTARQGQVVMVFTIVTIIFLPMSFIAAFFAIPIRWPMSGGALSLSYVSKFIFPIGIGISIPLIALAFSLNSFRAAQRRVLSTLRRRQQTPDPSIMASLEDVSIPIARFSRDERRSVETEKSEFVSAGIRRTHTGGSAWSRASGKLRSRFREVRPNGVV